MIRLYGIANCDTVRKARAWLDGRGLAYDFHDFKRTGVTPQQLAEWCQVFGWERVLNRSGSTFRGLDATVRAGLDAARAAELMQAQPSMIRRPILEAPAVQLIGFDAAAWERALA